VISTTETTATRQISRNAILSGILNIVEGAGKLLSLAPSEGVALFSAHLFPSTTICLHQDRELWYSISLLPNSPSRTIVKCEVYQVVPTTTEIQTNPVGISAVEALKDHLRGTIQACGERQCQLQDRVYVPPGHWIALPSTGLMRFMSRCVCMQVYAQASSLGPLMGTYDRT
jgi:hypothetical protein